ncbi:hypothetical protein DIPPA_18856 [Diplonema papillatum]|nr:hypothetical protein DIPPA_18856 [Diplonema papillatum]
MRLTRALWTMDMSRERALALLGLRGRAEVAEAKKAYRKLAAELHPDATTGLEGAEREKREEMFKQVSVAFAWYEAHGAGGPGEAPLGFEQAQPVGSDAWTIQQKKRVRFAVRQLKVTQRVQHIPLPYPGVDMEGVVGWVLDELDRQNMGGYNVHAVQVGPFGVPCVTLRGTVATLQEWKAQEQQQQQAARNPPSFSFAAAFRRTVAYLKEEI